MKSIFGIDLIRPENLKPFGVEIRRSGQDKKASYAMESNHSGFNADNFGDAEFDVRYFFKDLSPSDISDLKNGLSYLEFWLPVGDHHPERGISGNMKYYSAEDFDGAMTPGFRNRMSTGGVEGELDHPRLHQYSDDEKSKMNFNNNINRIQSIDKDNVVWYVVGFKRVGDISFFKFRTSITNTRVVNDMLNGKAPSASLRVMGDFAKDPITGIWRGKNIRFVTIDYVDNPGFKMASLFQGAIDLFKSGTNDSKKVEFTNNSEMRSTYAFESIDDKSFSDAFKDVSSVHICNGAYVILDRSTTKKKKSLENIINDLSIL